jgi:hypothetical protein
VVYPIANLLSTEQIHFGDMLVLDWDEEDRCIAFHREGQGAFLPNVPRRPARTAAMRSAAAAVAEEKTRIAARELEPFLSR